MNLELPSQLLLKHQENLPTELLIVAPPADELLLNFPKATAWCWHYGDFAYLGANYGKSCYFGILPPAGKFNTAVLFLPKAHEFTSYLLDILVNINECKTIFLVGEKKAGIGSAAKLLADFGEPNKIQSAKHSQLWQVEVTQTPKQKRDWLQEYTLSEELDNLQIVNIPGVFSYGRLDAGTELLLNNLDNLPKGTVLDYGAGSGVITAFLAAKYPQNKTIALEVDAFACEATRLTLNANNLTAEIINSHNLKDAPNNLSAIVSNPPFHQGVKTNYKIAEDLIHDAYHKLKRGGEIRIIANEFLGFNKMLKNTFANCLQMAHEGGYKVWSAIKH